MSMASLVTVISNLLPAKLISLAVVVNLVKPTVKKSPGSGGNEENRPGPAQQAQSSKGVPMHTADREFLPAALELLETPHSPILVSSIWSICLLFAGALAWSWFGYIDIHAVASG